MTGDLAPSTWVWNYDCDTERVECASWDILCPIILHKMSLLVGLQTCYWAGDVEREQGSAKGPVRSHV